MKKSFIFFSLFLSVFLLLIFQSSFCWAFEDSGVDVYLDSFSTWNGNDSYTLEFHSSTVYDISDLQYIYFYQESSDRLTYFLTSSPLIYVSTSNGVDYFGLTQGNFFCPGNITTSNGASLISDQANISSLDNATLGVPTDYVFKGTSFIYTDDTYSIVKNLDNYSYDVSLLGSSFKGAISVLSNSLSYNSIFEDFAVVVPFIGVVTLVAVGAYIINKQLNKSKKMR